MSDQKKYGRAVQTWLFVGVVMVFIQVIVGGITRLTESGLSITKWDVVSGTLPPMNENAWVKEFDLYKDTPQYREINEGMTMGDFKFIYFWEWVHRFWARFMGFVFLLPFLYFYFKKNLDSALNKKLLLVVCLAALAAIFGWIMVASGLVERPWVDAYKLSIHLLIAFSVFASLWWTYLFSKAGHEYVYVGNIGRYRRLFSLFTVVFIIQLLLGGILSGMKAAVIFPTWPSMHGDYLPSVIFDSSQWTAHNFANYDKNIFLPSLIHFLHRNTAYVLFVIGVYSAYVMLRNNLFNVRVRLAGYCIIVILVCQVLLGIITVISSQGMIPVLWGTLHQAFALLLLAAIVNTFFVLRIKKS
jgi:heme a synthase